MSDVGGTVLILVGSSAIRGSAVLLAAWAIAALFHSRSAALRHGIWTAAIAGVLIVPLAHLALPKLRAPFIGSVAASLARSGYWWWGHAFTTMKSDQRPVPGAPIGAGESEAVRSALDGVAVEPATPLSSRGAWMIVLLWFVGVLTGATRTLASIKRARGIVRRAAPVTDPVLLRLTGDLSAQGGLDRTPPLLETSEIDVPATIGISRPVIMLPLRRRWSSESRDARAVLTHEIAHVARRDCLTQMTTQIACALYWFNPLVWLAERRLRLEREQACDDGVLACGAVSYDYAELLVTVAREAKRTVVMQPAIAMVRPSELEARLVAILDPTLDRGSLGRRSARTLAILAAMIGATTGAVRVEPTPTGAPLVVAAADNHMKVSANGRVGAALQRLDRGQRPSVPRHIEPDTRGDSVASWSSERVDPGNPVLAERLSRAGLAGPDSLLVITLRSQLNRVPHGPDDLVRERATWALAQVRDGRLVEPLIQALGERSWRVRAYAAWALGVARDTRAVSALVAQTRDPIWRMRAMAAFALAEIADARARPAMLLLQDDEAWQVRVCVVQYFGHFNDPIARRIVRRALDDSHAAVRGAAKSESTRDNSESSAAR